MEGNGDARTLNERYHNALGSGYEEDGSHLFAAYSYLQAGDWKRSALNYLAAARYQFPAKPAEADVFFYRNRVTGERNFTPLFMAYGSAGDLELKMGEIPRAVVLYGKQMERFMPQIFRMNEAERGHVERLERHMKILREGLGSPENRIELESFRLNAEESLHLAAMRTGEGYAAPTDRDGHYWNAVNWYLMAARSAVGAADEEKTSEMLTKSVDSLVRFYGNGTVELDDPIRNLASNAREMVLAERMLREAVAWLGDERNIGRIPGSHYTASKLIDALQFEVLMKQNLEDAARKRPDIHRRLIALKKD